MANEVMTELREKMNAAVQAYSKNLSTIRAGRANPGLLDNVFVDYYGAPTPLNQLAQVGAPEARLLVVTPYDKTAINEIEKAIQKADLGLTPSSDGNLIRLSVPALTEERRKDLTKVVSKYAEEAKVQIRNVRRDANDDLKKLEKDSVLTEDEFHTAQDNVQSETDSFIEKIDELAATKDAEIMEV